MACNGTPGFMTYNELQYTMKSEVKKYTFKDWMDGKINPIKEGSHPVLKGEHGRIATLKATKQLSEDEAIKIQDAKVEAFHLAVKQGVQVEYAIKEQRIKGAEYPDKYIQSVVDEIDTELKDNPKILKRIYAKDVSTVAIDINLYKKIMEYGDSGVLYSKLLQQNELYRLKCRYLLREKLKSISEDPRAKLNDDMKSKISRVAKQIDSDNRSSYKFEEVEMYLSVYKAYPEIGSCEKRKDHAMKFLSEDASIRLIKAKANTLSTSWQNKLSEIS